MIRAQVHPPQITNPKITSAHLQKKAYVYIRQSTLSQVLHHQESTQRQYALREKALSLGWSESQLRILDRDLGQSGSHSQNRLDFKTLLADVSLGEVGAVLALEASRLARSNIDWHRLIELCSLTGTLLLDEDGCYDPADFNDALLLGLKGTMSAAELHFLRGRLQGGKRNKAERGQLRFPLPVGLCWDDDDRIVLDPDREVQGALRLVFHFFHQSGSAYGVAHQFAQQGLTFPKRAYGGVWNGRLLWGHLSDSRVLSILKNPAYAGVYVFGRFRCVKHILQDGKIRERVRKMPRDSWLVEIQNHHPGYLLWGQYLENQEQLERNRSTYGVVCWRREQNGWREAWSNEYWKSFDKLPWPISDTDERIPTFHAYIPEGADYAIVVFSETADNGWVTPDHHYRASLAAYSLADGHERWRFEIPIPDAQLFPTLFVSPDGRHLLVKVQNGSWNAVSYTFYILDAATGAPQGKSWINPASPQAIAVGNGAGMIAEVFSGRQLEVRSADGTLQFHELWAGGDPVSLVFSADGKSLYVADDADRLSCVNPDGELAWQVPLGSVSQLSVSDSRIYAAGWDGRVRAFSTDGAIQWTLDCTAAFDALDPLAEIVAASHIGASALIAVNRPSSATTDTPPGQDLVAANIVHLAGAKVEGEVIDALQRGNPTDAGKAMISPQQLVQDMLAGQQAQMILEFPKPTDVGALTVRENPDQPEAYPTDSFIGVWNESSKQWDTAKRGVFLNGPVNTYTLNLKGVMKLIYCPWNNYGHNFYTSKIEVRLTGAKDGYEENFARLVAGSINAQDFWKGEIADSVVPNPAGGQMLHVLNRAERPMAFNTDPTFVRQTVSYDFMFNRTINDPAFAVTQGVKQLFHGFVLFGPDPDQNFRFGYEGARKAEGSWINGLRLGNEAGPNTIQPKSWYHAKIMLDRRAGSFELVVSEKASGKQYWHPAPVPCGKLKLGSRGMNLIQFMAQNGDAPAGGFYIDNIQVTVEREKPVK